MDAIQHPPGNIITFYSYKGGTGRSLTLANVAWILAAAGKRVIVLDWDLEAPGLHRYFRPFLLDPELSRSDGIIDFVTEYSAAAMQLLEPVADPVTLPVGRSFRDLQPEEQMSIAKQPLSDQGVSAPAPQPLNPQDPFTPEWLLHRADLLYYKISLAWQFPSGGQLDFVPAGRQGVSYATRVNAFDWKRFYTVHAGGRLLDAMANRLRMDYDYTLVDSRTGVSDTSGICTIQLPDMLVVCFTLNNQSISGARHIAASVLRQRNTLGTEGSGAASQARRPISIFPIPMRIDNSELEKSNRRRDFAQKEFDEFLGHIPQQRRYAYWGDVEVPYIPGFGFEELLAPFVELPDTVNTLLAACERIAGHLTAGTVAKIKDPPSSETRERVVAAFKSTESVGLVVLDALQNAEAAFRRLTPSQQAEARYILLGSIYILGPGQYTTTDVGAEYLNLGAEAAQILEEAGAIRVRRVGGSSSHSYRIDGLLIQWSRLREWIEKDRLALTVRQELVANAQDWVRSGRRNAGLLKGDGLKRAKIVRNYLTAPGPELLKASESRRQRMRLLIATAVIAFVFVPSLVWFSYTRTGAYQIGRVLADAPWMTVSQTTDQESRQEITSYFVSLASVRPEEALSSAGSLDFSSRADVLSSIAQAQAANGHFSEAVHTTQRIEDQRVRADALSSIAQAQAAAGQLTAAQTNWNAALIVAEKLDDFSRAATSGSVAQAQAIAGQFAAALSTAHHIQDGGSQAAALSFIAQAQATAGHVNEAETNWDAALMIAQKLDDFTRADTFGSVAQAQAIAGQFAAALSTAQHIQDRDSQAAALSFIARSQAKAGRFDDAIRTANLIRNRANQDAVLSSIAQAQSKDSQFNDAIRTINLIQDRSSQASALSAAIGQFQAAAGDVSAAGARWSAALSTAEALGNAYNSEVLGSIAQAQAAAGGIADALRTAQNISDRSSKASALSFIARSQAKAGQFDDALDTVQDSDLKSDQSAQEAALGFIAQAQANAGKFDDALRTVGMIRDQVRKSSPLALIAAAQAKAHQWKAARSTAQLCLSADRLRAYTAILTEYAKANGLKA
ncbi:MAG TPA: hypothetical protein VIY49_23835 [Bryobacteraceae bacterium]